MALTGWGVKPTRQPSAIRAQWDGCWLYVTLGDGSACRAHSENGTLQVREPTVSRYQPYWAASLDLDPWRGPSVPELRLHPFAALHLLVRRQVPRRPLVAMLSRVMRSGSTALRLDVRDSCPVLTLLGVHQATIDFRSIYDFHLNRYAPK